MVKKLSPHLFETLDPFDGIDAHSIADDRKSWGGEDPFLNKVIDIARPDIILEIGTWKGASAIYMAHHVKHLGLDTEIICADPHVASPGLWLANKPAMHMNAKGECGTYDVFLANVKRAGMTDIITPFRVTSSIATLVMKKVGLKADVIYIDGAHDRIDVQGDLLHCLRILHEDGLLVCDDYDHNRITGVTEAVTAFLETHSDFEMIASHLTPLELYTEKVIGSQSARKVVLARKGSRFAKSFNKS